MILKMNHEDMQLLILFSIWNKRSYEMLAKFFGNYVPKQKHRFRLWGFDWYEIFF